MKVIKTKFKVGQKVRVINTVSAGRKLANVYLPPERYLGKVGQIHDSKPHESGGPLDGTVLVTFPPAEEHGDGDNTIFIPPSVLRVLVRRPALRKTEKKSAARKGFK